jgi:hypothetical protein
LFATIDPGTPKMSYFSDALEYSAPSTTRRGGVAGRERERRGREGRIDRQRERERIGGGM